MDKAYDAKEIDEFLNRAGLEEQICRKYSLSPTATLKVGVDGLFDEADTWRMHPAGGLNGPTRMLWYPVEGRSFYATLDMAF